uniref:Putative HNH endonuclease n=1 Tax=viral metagenome TaxID=1070528 RepID=A0A6M3JHX4_9ZZZZ
MKSCNKCGYFGEDDEFRKNRNICKNCHSESCKKWYKNNAEKMKKQTKEYYKNNIEKRKKQIKEYYKNNAERIKEYNKEWYKNNIDKRKKQIKEYNKEYCKQNKDCIKKYMKKYRNSSSLYDSYAYQISYAEEVRKDPENYNLLQVKCTYCNKWFNPTNLSIMSRVAALNGNKRSGEGRLYCSDGCKKLCPIHYQQKYPKDQKPYISRPLQKEWADMVKERDGYKCIKCGSTERLIAHHKEGIRWNPIESADIDIGITLCRKCEKKVHSIEGCSYYDMRCV